MPVRPTAAPIILRIRTLINDPASVNQQWSDQIIQDTMDESRIDVANGAMIASPTYSGSSLLFLDYYTDGGSWEDGMVIKQYLTNIVTPSSIEPIVGHFAFAQTTLPPLYITGSFHDVYRAAADLLERLTTNFMLNYDFSSDGQSFRRSQVLPNIQKVIHSYRMQQRAGTISMTRSDLRSTGQSDLSLKPTAIDYMSSGDGR